MFEMLTSIAVIASAVCLGIVMAVDVCRVRTPQKEFVCPHVYSFGQDPLCKRWGCPDDPNWKGDGCS